MKKNIIYFMALKYVVHMKIKIHTVLILKVGRVNAKDRLDHRGRVYALAKIGMF